MAVTRKDVASLAGVSPALVSYVINGGPRAVSDDARRRIVQAIEALSYRPDGLARSLRTRTTQTLALIVPDAANPFFAELARSIEDEAFGHGYAVLVCNSADDRAREQVYLSNLADRRIDGLIFISTSTASDQDLVELTRLGIPVVAVDRTPDDSPISTVRVDNVEAAYIGTTHLIEHGHTRVGLIAGPDGGVAHDRLTGWKAALAEHALPDGVVVAAPFTHAGGQQAGIAMFSETEFPTAVVVSSDAQAIGLLHALDAVGLRTPNDVAMVSIDGTEAAAFTVPPLTSVSQPLHEMARLAVGQLLRERVDASALAHAEVRTQLVRRRSCGCPPHAH